MIFQPIASSGKTLIPKNITENGIYLPETDNADGFSRITTNIHPGVIYPIHFDASNGYVYQYQKKAEYRLGGTTVSYNDIYQVEAGKHYILCLGYPTGTRNRAGFFTIDPYYATSDVVDGIIITYTQNPDSYRIEMDYAFEAPSDGYIAYQKDNAGTTNIPSFCFCLEDVEYVHP